MGKTTTYAAERAAVQALKEGLIGCQVARQYGDEIRFSGGCPECLRAGTVYINIKTGLCGCSTPGCVRSQNAVIFARQLNIQMPDVCQKWEREHPVKQFSLDGGTSLPAGIKRISDVSSPDLTGHDKVTLNLPTVNKLMGGGLLTGQVGLVTGRRGDGKSTFCAGILAQAIRQGYKCMVYSGELDDGFLARSIYRPIAGPTGIITSTSWDLSELYSVKPEAERAIRAYLADRMYYIDRGGNTEEILNLIKVGIEQLGVRVVLIDNLMSALTINDDKLYGAQAEFVKALANIATSTDSLILLVAHPRKSQGREDPNDAVSGSSVITDAVHFVFNYSRPDNDPESRVLKITKNRLTGACDYNGIPLSYHNVCTRIYEAEGGNPMDDYDFPGLHW